MRTLTQTSNVDYRIGERRFLEQSFKNQAQLIDFATRNETVLRLVRHIRVHLTGSESTCREYVYNVFRFCQWLGQEPDAILADVWDSEGVPIPRMLVRHVE